MRACTITDAFPSSEAFEAINAALSSDEAGRKDAIKNGKAVFAFTLKNKAGETASWHIDLKEKGAVATGLPENANGMSLLLFDIGDVLFFLWYRMLTLPLSLSLSFQSLCLSPTRISASSLLARPTPSVSSCPAS